MGKHGKGGKEIVAAGVDNTSRRKWDGAEFAQKAAEREEKVCVQRAVTTALCEMCCW